MSWVLGDITLPSPQGFKKEPVFVASDVDMLDGSTKRDVIRRKYRYVLYFEKLTQAEVTSILSEYAKDVAVTFTVNETNQSISANVLVKIGNREYNTQGDEFREDLEVVLIEV